MLNSRSCAVRFDYYVLQTSNHERPRRSGRECQTLRNENTYE